MNHLILFNISLFLISVAILFFVVKYRIHITVNYTPSTPKSARARKSAAGGPAQLPVALAPSMAPAESEIAAALVNLGCKPKKAREVAAKVVPAGGDFDAMLRRAIAAAA